MTWRTDAEGRCTWVSQAWCLFVGRDSSEQLGHGWMDVVHPVDRTRIEAELEHRWALRQPFMLFYRVRHHSGIYLSMRDRGLPIIVSGEFRGYWGVIAECTQVALGSGAIVRPFNPRQTQAPRFSPDVVTVESYGSAMESR